MSSLLKRKHLLSLAVSLGFVLNCVTASAQQFTEPEHCILETIKTAHIPDSLRMIHYNCVRQYIKSVEKKYR
jgi:hypothetical protein